MLLLPYAYLHTISERHHLIPILWTTHMRANTFDVENTVSDGKDISDASITSEFTITIVRSWSEKLRVFHAELHSKMHSKRHSLGTYLPSTTEPHSKKHSKGAKEPQIHSKYYKFRMCIGLPEPAKENCRACQPLIYLTAGYR